MSIASDEAERIYDEKTLTADYRCVDLQLAYEYGREAKATKREVEYAAVRGYDHWIGVERAWSRASINTKNKWLDIATVMLDSARRMVQQ